MENAKQKIKELEEQNAKYMQAEEALKTFCDIGKMLSIDRDVDKLIPQVMTGISKTLCAERSTLFLLPWERTSLWSKFAEGLKEQDIDLDLKMGLIGASVLTRQVVNATNAYEDPRFNPKIDQISGFRTESVLCAPFTDRYNNTIGGIELLNKKTGVFILEDEEKAVEAASTLSGYDFKKDRDRKNATKIMNSLRKAIDCQRSSIFLIDSVNGELGSVKINGDDCEDIRLSLNLGIAGLVAISGLALNINNVYEDPRFDKSIDERTGYRTRCIACVPIFNQTGDTIGVIETINKKNGDTFSDSDMNMLTALSSQVAMFIENSILSSEYHLQFKSILEVMAASIDAKDPLTAGHSHNVDKYACGIARELGFRESEIDILSVAALLHDYGKIGTDEKILKKKGALTPEEYEHIKQHAQNTREILDKMFFVRRYRNVPLIASCHHECLDGSGYADGRKAEEIPFMAKIITVADVFDALTAKRHYRDALPHDEAFKILDEGAGTRFDENVISALKRFWEKEKAK